MVVLSEFLRLRGHDITAVCPPGGWISHQLAKAGTPMLEWTMHGWRAPAIVGRLCRLVRGGEYDLIHTHLTRATYLGYLAGLLTGVPVVSTLHTWNRDWAYRWLPARNHWFVSVSQYLKSVMVEWGVSPERIRVIHNGTNFRAFTLSPYEVRESVRAELGIPRDAFLVGVFARVDEFKGQHIVVEAAGQMRHAVPEIHVLLAGFAAPSEERRIRDVAARCGLAERVHLTGVRDDVSRLMLATDVVAHFSVTETFGMAIIEAMAMGRPVIATRAGGIPEVVVDGVTGFLVERTPTAAAEALKRLALDGDLRAAMGVRARERAVNMFSAERMAEEMEKYYEDILFRRTGHS